VARRVEIHVTKRDSRLDAKRVGVRRQVCAQVTLGRLKRRTSSEQSTFASTPAIVSSFVQPSAIAPAINLLAHAILNQSVQLVGRGRTLPGAREPGRQRFDLGPGDDDLSLRAARALSREAECDEQGGAEHQEVNQRLLEQAIHYFVGVYQIGDV
jgi:hypothetical protein